MLLVLPIPGFMLNPGLWSDLFTCELDKHCNVQECLIKSVCLQCSSSANSMIQIGFPCYLQHYLYPFCFACTLSLKLFPYILPSSHIFFIQMETLQSNVVSGHPSFLCLIVVAIIIFWLHILQKLEVTKKLQNASAL